MQHFNKVMYPHLLVMQPSFNSDASAYLFLCNHLSIVMHYFFFSYAYILIEELNQSFNYASPDSSLCISFLFAMHHPIPTYATVLLYMIKPLFTPMQLFLIATAFPSFLQCPFFFPYAFILSVVLNHIIRYTHFSAVICFL